MSKQLLFLINPKAGKSEIRADALDIIDLFVRAGWKVVVHTTQRSGEIPEYLQAEAGNYELIVLSGGDGTLNETVSGLLASGERIPVGYIPAGTTNDFATSLGLPKNSLEAAQIIIEGQRFPCDVGAFNQAYFVYVAAFGAFTEVSYSTPQQYKNVLGRAAYILEGIRHLADIKTYPLALTHDGETLYGDFVFGMISNSTSVGGFKMNKIDVSMNDGYLEVLLVKLPRNPAEFQGAISALLRGEFNHPCLYGFRTNALKIHAAEPLSWTLDGEYGGTVQDVSVKVIEHAIQIMVPRQGKEQKIN